MASKFQRLVKFGSEKDKITTLRHCLWHDEKTNKTRKNPTDINVRARSVVETI